MNRKRTLGLTRNLVLTGIALLTALPYIFMYQGKLYLFFAAAAALCINALRTVGRKDDAYGVEKDRERAVNKLLRDPAYILKNGRGAGAPATYTPFSLPANVKKVLLSWIIVLVFHLLTAISIEDGLKLTQGADFTKYNPVWIFCTLLAVWDILRTLKENRTK